MVGLLKRSDSNESLLNNGPRSEYVKRYQIYQPDVTRSLKPKGELGRAEGILDSETVTRRDFPEHPLIPLVVAKPAAGTLRADGQHSLTSSYQQEFPEKSVMRPKPYKTDSLRTNLAAFDGTSSYTDHYPEHELPQRTLRETEHWKPPTQPFQGQTTTVDDYKEHQLSPRVTYKPDTTFIASNEPFDANSDYKETFREHSLPAKVPRQRQQWTKPDVPLDDLTTQQRDFKGQYLPRQKSLKPVSNIVKSDVPIEGETTTSITYRPHDLPQRYKHEPKQYMLPEESMDLATTHGTHFVEHPIQRPGLVKPSTDNILQGFGDMAKDTSYSKEFIEHSTHKEQLIKPKDNYMTPSAPMASQTKYQEDFHEHVTRPREIFKPKHTALNADPLDDRTRYRDDFVEHLITPRETRPRDVYTKPTKPLESTTTNSESFPGHYQPKQRSFRPDHNLKQRDEPFNGNTTMNSDFQPYDIQRRELPKSHQYQKPEGDMDLVTTHSTHYTEHPIKHTLIQRRGSSDVLKGAGNMDSQTNYMKDFIERPLGQRISMKPLNEYHSPTEQMANETTHRAFFQEHLLQDRQSFKPRDNTLVSSDPLDDRTDYRDSFIPHKVTPREKRPQNTYEPPSAPFESITTVQDAYQGPYIPKRESYKPEVNLVASSAPFNADTITSTDFKQHQIPELVRHKHDSYNKPEGIMDMSTTHSSHFTEHQLKKRTLKRPGSSGLLKGSNQLEQETSYHTDFKEQPLTPRQKFQAKSDYQPPSAPMDSTTTHQDVYQAHVITPRARIKSRPEYTKPNQPLEDRTSYRDQFLDHKVAARPAKAHNTYQPPSAPMESVTTNQDSYLGPYQPRRSLLGPDRSYVKPELPMESSTTFQDAFKEWSVGKTQRHQPREYVKPEGTMDLTTVNRETFRQVGGARLAPIKAPSSQVLPQKGTFHDVTSYSKDFVPKSLLDSQRYKPESQYTPSSFPMEDKTEYRASHLGFVSARQPSCKPRGWSDALGQRDPTNPFHIRVEQDWRHILQGPGTTIAA